MQIESVNTYGIFHAKIPIYLHDPVYNCHLVNKWHVQYLR